MKPRRYELSATRDHLEPAAWATPKIPALADANGLPILLKLTPGQAHNSGSFFQWLGK
jgi:hypothetical protein